MATSRGAETEGPRTLEFLAFHPGDEEPGIDIQETGEIRGHEAVTHVAHAPGFIEGMVRRRAAIVSLIDMCIRFTLCEPNVVNVK